MNKPLVYRGSTAAAALQHLAENGPTPHLELRTSMSEGSTAKDPLTLAGVTLRRLEESGLVVTKVWLTPRGLAELQRMGGIRHREGVREMPSVDADETAPA